MVYISLQCINTGNVSIKKLAEQQKVLKVLTRINICFRSTRALQNKLQQGTGVNVSDRSIKNWLHEVGLSAWHHLVGPIRCPVSRSLFGLAAEVTRICRSITGTLFFSQMRAGLSWAHVTDVNGSEEAVENIVIFSMIRNFNKEDL